MGKKRFLLCTLVTLVVVAGAAGAKNAGQRNFAAPLSGAEEVPSVPTRATGVATFQLSRDGSQLSYRINVANIQGVGAVHIHCAPFGLNGPVGVTLFTGGPTGAVNGVLVQNVIVAPNPGNGCGWLDLAATVAAMRSGATYVNVHTIPPGVPSGEIRGQIL